jgi:YfiH family protein
VENDRIKHVFNRVNSHGSFQQTSLRGLPYITVWQFTQAPRGIRIYFTTRQGGESQPPYNSLNLGFHVGDDPELVRKNRAALAKSLHIDAAAITCPRQRHTGEVAWLENTKDAGAGALSEASVFDPCDGLVTRLREAPILLHFADCLPVVLAGRVMGQAVLGVLHAGREGLVQGVVANGVAAMARESGVEPDSMVAVLGPAIGPCCYEVGESHIHDFRVRFGGEAVVGTARIDLAAAAVIDLKAAGVSAGNIHMLDICTSCDDHFFSYRRDGITGRHGAIAWIES